LIKPLRFLLVCIFLYLAAGLPATAWKTWKSGDITVTAAAKDSAYAGLVLHSLHQRINNFQLTLGVYPARNLALQILPSRAEYSRITSGKGKLVESSEAFYSPSEKVIYVRSPEQMGAQTYDEILMHEYIHWFLDETLGNVPLWFHEGMAMYYSGQFGFDAYYNFTRYRFMGYRLSLSGMATNYPAEKSQWDMFYLTSAFAVNYLNSHHKEEWQKFWDLVGYNYNRVAATPGLKVDFLQVFHASFKMSLVALSQEFDKTLRRYSWQFPFVGFNALIFALLPFVIVAGWLRSRKKMQALPDVIPEDNEADKGFEEEAPDRSEEIPTPSAPPDSSS
jgi:hypothetical protein